MGKHKKKQLKRLHARQVRWEQHVSKMSLDARRGYHKPGSMNSHKGA